MDNLAVISATACEGRLTVESGVSVPTSDQSARTTLYFTPYKGNVIDLYSGSYWVRRAFTERSLSLSGLTASTPYDIFAYDNAGTVTLEALAWTNGTTRATALTTQDGVYVKSGATTRRYWGTIYINSSGGQTDDSLTKRFVWNYYNRVPRPMRRLEGTNSWTYTTATIRQANGSASNQLEIVVGILEDGVEFTVVAGVSNTTTNVGVVVGVGEDSTSSFMNGNILGAVNTQVSGLVLLVHGIVRVFPSSVGYHFYSWNEFSEASGTTTWYGDAGITWEQSGIVGLVFA